MKVQSYYNQAFAFKQAFEFVLNGKTLYADDDNHVSETNPDLLKDGEIYEILAEDGHKFKKLKNGGGGEVKKTNFLKPLDADTLIIQATNKLKNETTKKEQETSKLSDKTIPNLESEIDDINAQIKSARKELKEIPPIDEKQFIPFMESCKQYLDWLKKYGAEYLKLGVTPSIILAYHRNNDKIYLHEFMLRNQGKALELFREVI